MIHQEQIDGIRMLRIDHGRANALDLELCESVVAGLAEAAAAGPRAIIITGRDGMFSAGVDLFRLLDGGASYVERFLPALKATLIALFECPVPVVAAVNGHAVAGGCLIVQACDYRIMSTGKGRIGVPELKVGVPFPVAALEVMRFAVPAERVQEVIYTGGTWSAEVALSRGLIDEVAEPGSFAFRAREVAEQLGATPPAAFSLTKRQVRAPVLERIERYSTLFDAETLAVWSSQATRDHIRSYLDATLGKR
jgi:enoyl-CoA hydratase